MSARPLVVLVVSLLLAACVTMPAPPAASQSIYVLDTQPGLPAPPVTHNLTLAVSAPQARPGFETAEIVYVQQPFELNYFATSRWAAPPAQMLESLLMQTLEQSGAFRAVVAAPSLAAADVRLDTQLLRLQQDFTTHPSRVRLTLRAQLVDVRGQRVLAAQQFDETEAASSENAYGGVTAANRALQRVLNQVTVFCIRESAAR